MRLLVVEDDATTAKLIVAVLRADGYAVDVARTGEEGRVLAFVNAYDGIVLDLVLRDRHGVEILAELRREGRTVPVLVLTGRDGTADLVRALDAGADMYVVKPVPNDELRAHVRALVRRGGGSGRVEQLSSGALVLNRLTRRVFCAGGELALTAREFAVLEHMMLAGDAVVTRTELLEKVWDMTFDPGSNVVDAGIARVRRKLADCRGAPHIATVRGAGYRLVAVVDGRAASGSGGELGSIDR